VRRSIAAVGAEHGRNFFETQPEELGLDDHLGGELHAGGAQVHPAVGFGGKGAHAAVEVADAGAEEESAKEGEGRVADVAILPGHGAGLDAASEAVAHHEVGAGTQALQKAGDVREVVAAVGIAHEDEAAAGGGDAPAQGVAVALGGDGDDAGSVCLGDGLGTVGAAVVGDDDLRVDLAGRDRGGDLLQAVREGERLVEAGEHDGEFGGSHGVHGAGVARVRLRHARAARLAAMVAASSVPKTRIRWVASARSPLSAERQVAPKAGSSVAAGRATPSQPA
jgi:hypothetical protein